MPDRRIVILIALLAMAVPAFSDEAGASAPAAKDGVPIIFLPPPLDGTVSFSIGIYGGAGKLLRVLHRESPQDDFKVGENGLIARWDGKNDAGQPVPPGKYNVNGWAIGDLGVDGVAFHGNDWIKDDSPRFTRVIEVKNLGRDEVRVTLRTAEGKEETLAWKLSREDAEPPKSEIEATVENGKLVARKGGTNHTIDLGNDAKALHTVVGNGDHIWTIVETPDGREVRSYSAEGEFLRRIGYQKGEPQPTQIAASQWEEQVFLLDENEAEQRLRALAPGNSDPIAPKPDGETPQPSTASAWKITYFKRVLKMETFDAISAHLGRKQPPKAEPLTKILACKNPLLGDRRTEVFVKVTIDAEGAVLTTKDDLPLAHLTDTQHLKWAALVREGTALVLFQSDGSVVEEFQIAHPDAMMAFDAGDYTLKAPGAKITPPKEKPALAPKRAIPLRPGDDL